MAISLRLVKDILAFVLVSGFCGLGSAVHAQASNPAPFTPARLASSAGATSEGAGATREGIEVHGDWTIEVVNRDGSLASRHEFHNDLGSTGNRILVGLLGRTFRRIDQWLILLGTSVDVCGAGVYACAIPEHLGAGAAPLGALTVVVPGTQANFADTPGLLPDGRVELRGTIQTVAAGSITLAGTSMRICRDSTCAALASAAPFSQRTLPVPIPVDADQIVQVKVVFTFS